MADILKEKSAPRRRALDESLVIKKAKQYDPFKNRTFIILPIVVLVVLITVFLLVFSVPEYADCQGTLEPLSYLPIYSNYSGKVTSTSLKDGILVENEGILVEFDNEEIKIAHTQLLSDLDFQQNSLARLLEEYEMFKKISTQKIEIQKKELEKISRLYKYKGISKKEAEIALHEFTMLKMNTSMENNQYQARVSQNRKVIEDLKNRIKEQEYRLQESKIICPGSGKFVMHQTEGGGKAFAFRDLSQGDFVQKGQLIGYIIEDDSYIAKIKIPENKIDKVEPGQTVKLYFTALSSMKNKFFEASLKDVSPSATNGYFIGIIEIPREMNQIKVNKKEYQIHSFLGTTLNAKIQLSKANFMAIFFKL